MTFEEWTKKKKKENENSITGTSFEEYSKQQLYGYNDITDNDIAPIDEKRTWFQAGAMDDDAPLLVNVAKTILGTTDEITENAWAGLLGMGEKIVDAGAYLVGGVGGLFGADEFAEDTKDFIAKDLYDERKVANVVNYIVNPASIFANSDDSLLGDKSDSLLQSGGQLLATAGLQAVGVPWFLTTGVTSFGGEVENAFNQGADYGEAGGSALISTGAEILTEKLSGGISFGGKTLDDVLLKPLVDKIGNKVVKTLVNLGLDAAGEGMEEVVSSVFSNLGSALYKEESIGELLTSEEAMDEYLESFIGGAVLGGGSNVGKVGNSIITGRDYKTGLTDNEQKVVAKAYETRLEEAEKGGEKLTNKEKNKIYDEVLEDLENGGIDIDTIEEVLGGDTYKNYKNTVDSEDALKKEYEELGKKTNATLAEQTRYKELHEQIKDIEQNSKRNDLKTQLGNEVFNLAKDGKLAESYYERARRGEAFTADVSKYKGKQAEVIQKAIDSGILNNTRRTHKFVDMVAKISADKGVNFDFTSNEKLKNSGFAVDGKFVNGYVTKDGITVNINSKKALNSVVGHEITHVLEGTELYTELQKSVYDYANTKGDYQSKRADIEKLYNGIKDADVDAELTADLVGDYLFTDTDFVRSLSTGNRNLFEKLFDEIKYLCKVATAGSKEARQLEKVKRIFEKAYKESGKSVTDDTNMFTNQEDVQGEEQPTEVNLGAENISPEQAQVLNIMSSNIVSEARKNNISLEQYYAATEGVNAYNPTKADVKTIADALEPIVKQLGNENYSGYLDTMRSYAEGGGANYSHSDNLNPTENPDIRFSLSKPVEETKDLLVLHNISESKLIKQLGYEGFPMPSLAVTNQPHTNFGSISILFDKDTIDPKKNKKNKTYSADAWTPTFPRIEYETDREVERNFFDAVKNLIDNDYYRDGTHTFMYDVEGVLNRNGGYDGLIDYLAEKPSIQYAFLKSRGENVDVAQKQKEIPLGFSTDERWINRYEGLIEDFGGDISGLGKIPYTELIEQSPTIKNLLERIPTKSPDRQLAIISKLINDAQAYQNYNPGAEVEVEYIPDYAQTDKDMQARIDTNELKEWLKEQTNGIVANSGVYNGKDVFTPSGNRRSFKQLHYPVTVENIVKSMASQGEKSVTGFNGVKTLRATTVKTFKSIAEIQKAKGKLQNLSQAEANRINDELSDRMYEVFNKIIGENPKMFRQDDIFAIDTIGEILSEVEYENINASYIKGVFNKYGYNMSSEVADGCLKLLDAISSMPVYIFEAKPQRVVGYDEIKAVVIPDNTSEELKNALTQRGISFVEYDGTEADRQAKLKDVATANDSYFSLSRTDEHPIRRSGGIYGEDVALEAPAAENIAPVKEAVVNEAPMKQTEMAAQQTVNEAPIITTKQKISAQVKASEAELEKNIQARKESNDHYDKEIAHAESLLDGKKNKNTKAAQALVRRIERLKRLKASEDANFEKRINDIESRVARLNDQALSNHDRADNLERFKKRAEAKLEAEKKVVAEEFEQRRSILQEQIGNKDSYISNRASELYNEISNLKKGVRASKGLGYLLDHGYEWKSIKTALINAKHRPNQTVNANSAAESVVREMLNEEYENKVYELDEIELEYNDEVAKLEAEAEKELEAFQVANRRSSKQQEYSALMENLVGDTSTWVDKKLGLQYKTNTLRRNLRDIVRDENGNKDIEKADAIYDELQGNYNHNEASLNRETNQIKKPYAEMKFTKAEDAYIQMLGEFRHNPDTTLTQDVVEEFYDKHKDSIDVAKVDSAIDMARQTYDDLLERVNEALREQGMKEIPYRKGYFPHFTEDKQNWFAKLINWKIQNNEIPTDIAGLTEQFNPNRSWQSFNKQRKTDDTDYSFSKGLDTYVQGSLDWIYHIEDIQKRRALENYIRYSHSEQGVKDKIDAIRKSTQYDADEMQEQIDLVYKNANNPLNNFVTDLRAGTNRLANKKSSLDRGMEEMVNRKVYSTMTNLSNRVTANMVGGSISSALTNFIPITQSWGMVSPVSSLRAMGETIRSAFKNDGVVDKSDFLTNRLNTAENLYKTTWDKIGDKVGLPMEIVDNFTSQTVWRSKYLENINNGMSESAAVKDADQFAENVMAGRSRGNNPTIFDSKNPLIKTLTAFQLEVNNQYGYMLKDMPQDMRNESVAKLVKGYATMFLGAYVYNALYSSLTGRDAAFDPIGIIEELLGDLFDDEEEEPTETIMNLTDNIVEEVPFVGGLVGGGRIPISSALPYGEGIYEAFSGTMEDIGDKDFSGLTKEWLNPLIYLALPMGGGQIKKTVQGLSMFSDDHPIAGSYTDSGNLRFPVDDTIGSRIQAGIFGQWANKNAQTYLDKGYAPLDEKQIQEYKDVGMPINDYWEYRRGLSKYSTLAEKADYINSLNLTTEQKNILINNLTDRKEPIDMSDYGNYGSFEEFEFASKNPGKYTVSKAVGGYDSYKKYSSDLNDIKADKDVHGNSISGSRKKKVVEYVNSLDVDYGIRLIIYKSEYKSDHTYNRDIVNYLNSREDLSYNDIKSILTELGFYVDSEGNISWD